MQMKNVSPRGSLGGVGCWVEAFGQCSDLGLLLESARFGELINGDGGLIFPILIQF